MSIPIRQLMQKAVIQAAPEETVGELRQRMAGTDVGALPVITPQGVLMGIVTADDLMADLAETLPVSRVMSSPVHTVAPEVTAGEAARIMRDRRHHHLVVVDGAEVVGMLSSFDLLAAVR